VQFRPRNENGAVDWMHATDAGSHKLQSDFTQHLSLCST